VPEWNVNLTSSVKHHEGAGPVADIEEARKAFERIDVDGDGYITAAEFKKALAQGGDWNVTESVAEAVIAAQDLNGDKLLSFDEFWAHINK
jgi:Ca2+-binding EF-hand superfamily protein